MNEVAWTSIEVTVPVNLTDLDYIFTQARTMFGTPPQPINLTLNLAGDLLSPWGVDCNFCAGEALYDPTLTTTMKDMPDTEWGTSVGFSGHYVQDTVGFEGIFSAKEQPFVVMDVASQASAEIPRLLNGHLGLFVNKTAAVPGIFKRLWDQGSLLNPVMGLRWDPLKPRLTIGALDPEDYVGAINWVPLEDRYSTVTGGIYQTNEFPIDGVKGFNGSLLPFPENPTAILHAFSRTIQVPPSNPYALNVNYTGPQQLINIYPDGGFGFGPCNATQEEIPYVHLTVTINGVDYPIDSLNNLLRAPSMMSALGVCNVGISNTTTSVPGEDVPTDFSLGLPFFRSVYIAYRFPTDDCPGFYGFAFPSGLNRTSSIVAQKPTSTPDLASQCLSLTAPTSTPMPDISGVGAAKSWHNTQATGEYALYGTSDEQVRLMDAELLDALKWDTSLLMRTGR